MRKDSFSTIKVWQRFVNCARVNLWRVLQLVFPIWPNIASIVLIFRFQTNVLMVSESKEVKNLSAIAFWTAWIFRG